MTTISPRPEAQPSTYNELSKTQQRAVSSIVQYLDQFVLNAPPSTDAKSSLFRLDLKRSSNVLLIDGERGSGKTVTLLTLLAYLKSPFDPENKDLAAIREGVDNAVRRNADAKRATGIPVPVLDMQPLPRGTSLLMQLATRLYKLVESHPASADHRGEVPALSDHADAGQILRTAWQRLVRAAASAEPEGSRSRNLTPEDLADELEAQERERADLIECWSTFVDRAAEVDLSQLGYKGSTGGEPCLIISIDDADMNPARCVELLELVRSLWHPRVVFLLTGYTDLFHALLQRKFEKVDGLYAARAERLARLYFDKVVPKHHRFAVWADADSALKLLSSSAGVWSSVIQSVPELKPALPRRWRAVRDLAAELVMHGAPGPTSARALLRSALDEADLEPSAVRHLERHVMPALSEEDDDAKALARFVLDDGDLVLQSELRKQTVGLRPAALSLALHKRGQSQVALKAGRVVAAGSANQAPIPLPREVEAALYLAAISADDIGEGGRLNRELTPASYPFADAHVKADKLDLSFAWPTPEWVKTLDFLLFRQRWEQILDEFRPLLAAAEEDRPGAAREEAVERLVYTFLSTLCTLAKDGERSAFDAKETVAPAPDWDRLARRLVELAKDTSHPRQQAFADWAVTGATMFFWAEYGLPPTAHDEFARCWLRRLWRSTTNDGEYQELFGRVIEERQNHMRHTAEQLSVTTENDVKVLANAVFHVREPRLRELFRDMDQQSVARWAAWSNSKPTERDNIVQDITNKIVSAVRTRSSQEVADILNANTLSAHAHFSFHVRDQLDQIKVVLPADSSVELYGPVSLRFYVDRHAELGGWPRSRVTQNSSPNTKSGRALISSLQGYSNEERTSASVDALKECIRTFAQGGRIPDMSDVAMLSRTHEPPAVGLGDKIQAIQPALLHDWTLQIVKIDRDAWWRQGWDQVGAELVGLLTSLHDLMADQHDIERECTEGISDFENHLCFTEQLAVSVKDSELAFMAPEPKWLTVYELKMLVGNYGVIAEQMLANLDTQKARTAMNIYCLALVICANRALLRHPDWDQIQPIAQSQEWGQRKLGEERFAIRTARDYLSRIRSRHYRGRRWQAVEAWARYGVPLYAAPESGMTEEEAGEWLSLFADAIEQDRDQLRAVRRYRAKLALHKAERSCEPADVDMLLNHIDAQVPATHAWLRLIERRASPPATPMGGTSTEPPTAAKTKRKPTHSSQKPKTAQQKPKAATRNPKTTQRR